MSQTIDTANGSLELVEPKQDDLYAVRWAWPAGIARLQAEGEDRITYGFILRQGEREVWGVKLQQADRSEEAAYVAFQQNRLRVATIAQRLAGKHPAHSLLAGAYMCEGHRAGLFEVGFILFPTCLDPEAAADSETDPKDAYIEDAFPGCANIVKDFFTSLPDLPEHDRLVDINIHPLRGLFAMDLFITNERLVCLVSDVQLDDPLWETLANEGATSFLHMPSVPFAMDD